METDRDSMARRERLELQPIAKGVSLIRPKFASGLILLMSGVGLLLFMICANVGGLLLARASARREETAVRLAIGATTGRLVRQWLTESLVLTAIGGAAGLCVAFAAAPLLVRRASPAARSEPPRLLTLSLDLAARRPHAGFRRRDVCRLRLVRGPSRGVRGNTRESACGRSKRPAPRRASRCAGCWWRCKSPCVLFCWPAPGLLVSTFRHLRALDPGFDRDHIVTFSLDPEMANYTCTKPRPCARVCLPP